MTIMIEKKKYEKPSMKVFELQQQLQLLAGSGTPNGGDFDPYQPGGFSW